MTARRARILLLTPYPLLPADSGGRLYALGNVTPLADEYEYHLLALANPEERAEIERGGNALREEYARWFASVHFEERPLVPHEFDSDLRVLAHFLRHTVHRLPLMDLSYLQPRAIETARRLIAEHEIDWLEIHHLHAAFYRRFLPALPAVLVNHNLEQDLWPFWRREGGFAPRRWVWNGFGALSRRFARAIETENSLSFDARAFISTRDLERVPDTSGPRFLVPMPVETSPEKPTFALDRFRVLWIGGFGWAPNVEAMQWFCERIWPRVRAGSTVPAELHIVGASPPGSLLARHGRDGIVVHGYVDDVEKLRDQAEAFVVPLRTGGGVRIKIVEALARGLPVVSTSKGCEGLPVEAGRDLLIADDEDSFAAELLTLSTGGETRRALSEAGRDYTRRHHSPKAVGDAKRRVYQCLAASDRGRTSKVD